MKNSMKLYKLVGKEITKQSDGKYFSFAKALKITEVINITDNDTAMQIVIKFVNFFGEIKSVTVTPSILSNKLALLKLSDKGMDINDENIKDIQEYLYYSLNEERDYQLINKHTKLGFCEIKGNLSFKHYNLISKDGVNEGSGKSTYDGLIDLKPKGSFEEYCEFLKEEIKDSHELQLAVSLSLTAPMLWLVSKYEVEIESMVINLAGKSSSGKSTMLMLMTSLWGNCQVTSNNSSLIKNWNSTSNALLKEIANEGFQGMPIALDEVGMANIKDFSKFIYTVSSGMDKKRLTSQSSLMEIGTFKTCVISSGELTMRDNITNKTIGSNIIRLIEFHNVQWTSSAEQANRVKRFVIKNYGTFGPEYIEYLLEDIDTHMKNWQITVDEIKDRVIEKIGSYGERLAMKFSLILTACFSFMSMLELEDLYDQEAIFQLLLNTLNGQDLEIDLSRKAYDCIMNEFVENNSAYLKFKDTRYTRKDSLDITSTSSRVYGKYCNKEYVIIRDRFESVLRKHGFKDIKGILLEWQEKDIIVSENTSANRRNPYNRRIVVGQAKVPVVVIRKDNIYENDITDEETDELTTENERNVEDIESLLFQDDE